MHWLGKRKPALRIRIAKKVLDILGVKPRRQSAVPPLVAIQAYQYAQDDIKANQETAQFLESELQGRRGRYGRKTRNTVKRKDTFNPSDYNDEFDLSFTRPGISHPEKYTGPFK